MSVPFSIPKTPQILKDGSLCQCGCHTSKLPPVHFSDGPCCYYPSLAVKMKDRYLNRKEYEMTKDAMKYSLELLEYFRTNIASLRGGGEITHESVTGPSPSKIHKDKRLCVVVKIHVLHDDGGSSIYTFENPVDNDYTDKTDYLVEHLFV